MNTTTTCTVCECKLYRDEGKSTCKEKECPAKVTAEHRDIDTFTPPWQPKKDISHLGFQVLKVLIFVMLPSWLIAQDTICLDKTRLGRIADSLSYYKQQAQYFKHCDTLLSLERKLSDSQAQEINAKDVQMNVCTKAYAIKEHEAQVWEETATRFKDEYNLTFKQLQKARKARKIWTGTAFTVFGVLGATITAVAILLK